MAEKEVKNKIIKHKKERSFSIVDRDILKDERISWKAKGILIYLLDQREGWNFYESELKNHSSDGRISLASGLTELESNGYLIRVWKRKKGKYSGRIWHVYERPIVDQDELVKCKKELEEEANLTEMETSTDFTKPDIGKHDIGKHATNDTNNNNNNIDDEDIIAQEMEEFGKYIGFNMIGQAAEELYQKWRYAWGFSSEEVRQAGETMVVKAKNRNLAYVDEILYSKLTSEIN